jgi:hypothetical protein
MRCSSCFRFFLLSCTAMVLATISRPAQAQSSDLSYARIVRVSLVSGDVQISRPGHTAWEPAVQNMPVTQGVTIGTNNGYAEIEFEDGTTAWISRDTLVQFTELALADAGRITKLTLAQGTMSVLTAQHRGDSFTLATSSQETVAVPKNAFFRVDAFHDGASVSVMGGDVQVISPGGTHIVPKGKTLAYQSKLKNVSLTPNPKTDEWDRWTVGRARTSQTETAQSLSYVDAPFSYGLADMSAYGAWNYVAGYGYGWQPYGMGNCWMPFMNGQWGMYPGLGWTWVSDEPWGWTPYHFGSWDFVPSYGWTWFPSQFGFWDPAPVDWYSAGNQVAWSPAAFGDPTALMFDQMTAGCGGAGGYGGAANSRLRMAKAVAPNRRPMAPHLILTTGRLGHGDSIGLFAYNGVEGSGVPFRSTEPLENGKPSGVAFSALGMSAGMAPRTLVPTAPDTAHLQRLLASSGASLAAVKLATTPASGALRAVNAMPTPAMPSHRPSPRVVVASRTGAYFAPGSGNSGFSGASSRMSSAPISASAHASGGGGGRPH